MQKKYAEVIICIAHEQVDRCFSYKIKDEHKNLIQIGSRVVVPFGPSNKRLEAYITGFSDTVGFNESLAKTIISVTDEYPFFSEELLTIANWMKKKYYCTLSDCLQCIMPAGIKMRGDFGKKEKIAGLMVTNEQAVETAECYEKTKSLINQARILRFLIHNKKTSTLEIKKELNISDSPLTSLQKKGLIFIESHVLQYNVLKDLTINDIEKNDLATRVLTEKQQTAFDMIRKVMDESIGETVLLHGVTGSGKTEVYIRLIQDVISRGKDAIILVPEISLTPQTVKRILERFSDITCLTHSKMSVTERFMTWQTARSGKARIMVGPRSAVFAPFSNTGIIIIDEEHENTYKSDITPKYDAREVARYRMQICGGIVVLASATPSIESYYKAKTGEFQIATIDQRVGKSVLPQVSVVDMREELENGNRSIFSAELISELEKNIENHEQTILFLNRRGHSSFVSCRKCGYIIKCDNCSISYTYHKVTNKLVCHYCAKTIDNPDLCPQCNSKYIKYFGVGTQKIEEEVKKLFPEAKTLRMDMDTTSKKNSHEHILKQFGDGEAQILIGTQMIAKGHDFPRVTLVGIVAADMSLNVGDYSSAETTYQLITQVSGRAGRGKISGRVVIQTYNPSHYSIVHSINANYQDFYKEEIMFRKASISPPFSYFFIVQMTSEDERRIIVEMFKLREIMVYYNKKRNNFVEIYGPMSCYIAKIRNQYRWKILVKSNEEERLKSFVLYCIDKLKKQRQLEGIALSLTLNPKAIQ